MSPKTMSRKAMSYRIVAAAALVLTTTAIATLRAEPKPAADGEAAFQKFTQFIGEWHFDGPGFMKTDHLVARETIEWSAGRKFIRVATFITPDGQPEYQRYDAIWGVKDGVLTSWNFDLEGHTKVQQWKLLEDGKTLQCIETIPSGQTLKQQITTIDDTQMNWKVWIGSGDDLQQIMDGVWKKSK